MLAGAAACEVLAAWEEDALSAWEDAAACEEEAAACDDEDAAAWDDEDAAAEEEDCTADEDALSLTLSAALSLALSLALSDAAAEDEEDFEDTATSALTEESDSLSDAATYDKSPSTTATPIPTVAAKRTSAAHPARITFFPRLLAFRLDIGCTSRFFSMIKLI